MDSLLIGKEVSQNEVESVYDSDDAGDSDDDSANHGRQ